MHASRLALHGRQLGNGVTPPAAEFLLRAVAASLDGA